LADVLDGLDELLDAALVRESIGERDVFAFSHHLVHQAAYRSIAVSTRRRLHRRAGHALASFLGERATERAAVIARHFDEAGATDAVLWYETAAQRALSVFANDDAITLASRGLELAISASARFALLALRETGLSRSARHDEQQADCDALLALAREQSNLDWEWVAVRRAVDLAAQRGESKRESALARRLQKLARATGDSRRIVEGATLFARWLVNSGRTAESLQCLSDIESLITSLNDPSTEIEYWWGRVFAESTLRAMAAAQTSLARMASAAAAGGRRADPRTLRAAAIVAMQNFDADALTRSARDALELYTEAGDIEGIAFAHQHLAIAAWERFDIEAQRRHLALATDMYQRIGKPSGIYTIVTNRGVVATQLGLFSEAESAFRTALELAIALQRPHWIVLSNLNLACVAHARGGFARAQGIALDILSSAQTDVHRALALEALGTAERGLGDFEGALAHLEAAAAAHREMRSDLIVGPLSELIPAYIEVRRATDAMKAADELAPLLLAKPSTLTFPIVGFARLAQAYRTGGRRKAARAHFERALTLLRERVARIPDEATRRAYLAVSGHEEFTKHLAGVDAPGTLLG
ncbi:MAG: hypothetical protein JOY69_06690, partial [Candidatus Eremiobacteraeota bacterium]|nr:hypothetical protein [Candidatus Eremiobacteraeota bacterium]